MGDFGYRLDVSTEGAHEDIRNVEEHIKRAGNAQEEMKRQARMSFRQVLSMAQMSWGVMDAMMRTMGINVSMQFRLLMRTGFAAIRVLTPLLTAQAMTPMGWLQAGIGLTNLTLAFVAIKMAEMEERQVATQVAALTEGLSGINSMIGSMSFM